MVTTLAVGQRSRMLTEVAVRKLRLSVLTVKCTLSQWVTSVVMITSFMTVACDPLTSVQGFVFDSEWRPIPRASVQLVQSNSGVSVERETDEQGAFVISTVSGSFFGRFTLTISK